MIATPYLSCVIGQVYQFIFKKIIINLKKGQIDEASRWRVYYQLGFRERPYITVGKPSRLKQLKDGRGQKKVMGAKNKPMV